MSEVKIDLCCRTCGLEFMDASSLIQHHLDQKHYSLLIRPRVVAKTEHTKDESEALTALQRKLAGTEAIPRRQVLPPVCYCNSDYSGLCDYHEANAW